MRREALSGTLSEPTEPKGGYSQAVEPVLKEVPTSQEHRPTHGLLS